MKFSILLIFCGFVQSTPVICWNSVRAYNYEGDSENVEETHKIVKKSVNDLCSLELQDIGSFEETSTLPGSTLETLTSDEDIQEPHNERTPKVFVPVDIRSPMILPALPLLWNNWPQYDTDYIQDSRPDADDIFASAAVPSVRSLPPVIVTRIHETIPDFGDSYNLDLDMDNDVYLTPNVRAIRSRNNDFLDQLRHDAMIPNIIPTMPIPFMRTSSPIRYEEPEKLHQAPLVAVFPGTASDCALPYLFLCSPKVSFGSLAPEAHGEYPAAQPATSDVAYRGHDTEDIDLVNQV